MLSVFVFLGTAVFLLQRYCVLSAPQAELLTNSVLEEEDPSKLFAVIGGDSCANTLFYGPQAVNKWGSVDGQHPHYFSTTAGSVPHDTWLQVVTDGTREFFRIYWYFTSDKTVQQRLVDADVIGASWYDYSLNQLGFTNVFTDAVVAAIPGIKASEVRDMEILHVYGRRRLQHQVVVGNESSAARPPGLRAGNHNDTNKDTLAGRCMVKYYVTVPKRQGISYDEMSQALDSSLRSNQFTSNMQALAVQQNVPALQTATSTSASMYDFSTTSKPKPAGEGWQDTPGAIAGISIGCIILLSCVLTAYCAQTKRSSSMQPSAFGYHNTPGTSPVPYNVPPAQGMAISQNPDYATVHAGVEMPGVYGGGVRASAPPAGPSSSVFSFGRTDPSHTRW